MPVLSNSPKLRREAVLDIYNLVLVAFLFATPWLFAYAKEVTRLDIWMSSAAIGLVSILAIIAYASWQEWINVVLGVWLIVSPWVLGFAHTRAMHFSIGIGIAVAFLAATELLLLSEGAEQQIPSG